MEEDEKNQSDLWDWKKIPNHKDISLSHAQIAYDEAQHAVSGTKAASEELDYKALRIITWAMPILLAILFLFVKDPDAILPIHWFIALGTGIPLGLSLLFSYQVIQPKEHGRQGAYPDGLLHPYLIAETSYLSSDDEKKRHILLTICQNLNTQARLNIKIVDKKAELLEHSLSSFGFTLIGGGLSILLYLFIVELGGITP